VLDLPIPGLDKKEIIMNSEELRELCEEIKANNTSLEEGKTWEVIKKIGRKIKHKYKLATDDAYKDVHGGKAPKLAASARRGMEKQRNEEREPTDEELQKIKDEQQARARARTKAYLKKFPPKKKK
jgi:GTPase involved in cell partitioning and DNA repair